MKLKRKQLPTLLLVAALATSGRAQAAETITLQQAFALALEQNIAVESAEIEGARAEQRVRYFRSFVFPRVSLSGAYTLNSEEASFGNGDERRVIQPRQDWTARLGFQQPIYAGAREWRAYRQAQLGVSQAADNLADVENQVLLAVGFDYLAAVLGQALVAVEEKNLGLARRRLDQSKVFYEVGEVTEVDVLRAEAGLKAAERLLAAVDGERQKALGRLEVALKLDSAVAVLDPGNFLPAMPEESALLAQALAANPTLAEAEKAIRVAELEVKKQRGAVLPLIYAEGGYQQQKRDFPSSDNAFLTLNVSVPLFVAGETKALVEDARQQERLARLRLDDLERRLRQDLHAALLDVETARRVLALAREELVASDKEHTQAFELYRAQEATALDLEAAELSLAQARRTTVTADIDVKTAELRAWYFAGALRTAFGPKREETP